MAKRAMWSGTVSFGLVAIPVIVVPAVQPGKVSFHLLHQKDHARLERRMVCPKHNTVVHPEHILRGVEIASDNYVVVKAEELDALEPDRSQTIEITEFVDLDAIDPMYYDRPYYLAPGGADRPYRLLVAALADSRKVGIARFVMHQREYLVALRSIDGALCLLTLHYPEDLVGSEELETAAKAPAKQVQQMQEVIEQAQGRFDPAKYEDPYQDALKEIVERKRKKEGTVQAPPSEEALEVADEGPISNEDLIAALESSLHRARKKKAG